MSNTLKTYIECNATYSKVFVRGAAAGSYCDKANTVNFTAAPTTQNVNSKRISTTDFTLIHHIKNEHTGNKSVCSYYFILKKLLGSLRRDAGNKRSELRFLSVLGDGIAVLVYDMRNAAVVSEEVCERHVFDAYTKITR